MEGKMKEFTNIITEIIVTEKTYIKDMLETYESYYDLFRGRFEYQDTLRCLEDIPNLVACGEKLLSGIVESNPKPENISAVFDNVLFDLKEHYSEYCSNFPGASLELMPDNIEKKLDDELKQAQSKFNQMLPLQSYLLKPVQRVLKYPLLIRSIIKLDIMNDMEKNFLLKTLKNINMVADYINEKKREKEGIALINHFNNLIINLTEKLTLASVGPVQQHDEFYKGSKKVYVILFTKILLVTKPIGTKKYHFYKAFPIADTLLLENTRKSSTAFTISLHSNRKKTITLDAKNKDTKNKWITHIKALLLDNMSVNFNNTKLEALLGESVGSRVQTILSVKEDVANSTDNLIKRRNKSFYNSSSQDFELNKTPTKEHNNYYMRSVCTNSHRAYSGTPSDDVSESARTRTIFNKNSVTQLNPSRPASSEILGSSSALSKKSTKDLVETLYNSTNGPDYFKERACDAVEVLQAVNEGSDSSEGAGKSSKLIPWSRQLIIESIRHTNDILKMEQEDVICDTQIKKEELFKKDDTVREEHNNHFKGNESNDNNIDKTPYFSVKISENLASRVQKLLESQRSRHHDLQVVPKVTPAKASLVGTRLRQLQNNILNDLSEKQN